MTMSLQTNLVNAALKQYALNVVSAPTISTGQTRLNKVVDEVANLVDNISKLCLSRGWHLHRYRTNSGFGDATTVIYVLNSSSTKPRRSSGCDGTFKLVLNAEEGKTTASAAYPKLLSWHGYLETHLESQPLS